MSRLNGGHFRRFRRKGIGGVLFVSLWFLDAMFQIETLSENDRPFVLVSFFRFVFLILFLKIE